MKTKTIYLTPAVELYLVRIPLTVICASGIAADKLIEENDDLDWEDIF